MSADTPGLDGFSNLTRFGLFIAAGTVLLTATALTADALALRPGWAVGVGFALSIVIEPVRDALQAEEGGRR